MEGDRDMESIKRLRKYVAANTDESYALTSYPPQYKVVCLTTINDIIDAIEREVEERYIEAPVDADGVPIHLYDHLKVDGESGVYVVGNMTCCTDGWLVGTNRGQIGRPEEDAHHHKPPTVEDVLRDFALEIDPAADVDVSGAKTIVEYAKRLQLKEGE